MPKISLEENVKNKILATPNAEEDVDHLNHLLVGM